MCSHTEMMNHFVPGEGGPKLTYETMRTLRMDTSATLARCALFDLGSELIAGGRVSGIRL